MEQINNNNECISNPVIIYKSYTPNQKKNIYKWRNENREKYLNYVNTYKANKKNENVEERRAKNREYMNNYNKKKREQKQNNNINLISI